MVLIGVLNHFDKRFPDRGFSVQEMLQILYRQLDRREAQLIIVLDEAEEFLILLMTSRIVVIRRQNLENMVLKIKMQKNLHKSFLMSV